jgi:hypothetical protein
MMITTISPLCIESVTYQHVYYIHLLRKFQPTNHNGYIALQALRDAPYKLHTSLSPIRRGFAPDFVDY